jgi:hypothetical protein
MLSPQPAPPPPVLRIARISPGSDGECAVLLHGPRGRATITIESGALARLIGADQFVNLAARSSDLHCDRQPAVTPLATIGSVGQVRRKRDSCSPDTGGGCARVGSEEADAGTDVHPPASKRFAVARPPATYSRQSPALPAGGPPASSEDIQSQSDDDWDYNSEEDSDDEWRKSSAGRAQSRRRQRPAQRSRPARAPTAPPGPGAPPTVRVDRATEVMRTVPVVEKTKVAVRGIAVRGINVCAGAGEQVSTKAVSCLTLIRSSQ